MFTVQGDPRHLDAGLFFFIILYVKEKQLSQFKYSVILQFSLTLTQKLLNLYLITFEMFN